MTTAKIPSIQYIRGLSALAVVLCHYGASLTYYPKTVHFLSNGQLGIYTFFLISGFVIVYSLSQNHYQPKSFFKFLLKRSVRIDPPYIIIILLYFLTFYLLTFIPEFQGQVVSFIPEQFLAHILYIIPFTNYEFYDHVFWTLSIEFQFYFLIGIFYFISTNRYFQSILLALFTASSFIPATDGYYIIFNYAPAFATGIALMHYYKLKNFLNFSLLIFCLFTAYLKFDIIICCVLIIAVLIILYSRMISKPLNILGELSYSLYITHTLILILLNGIIKRLVVISAYNDIPILLFKISIAIILAYIYYIIVEKPAIKLSKSILLKDG